MNIAILTFDGFNEIDSLLAFNILNRVRKPGWRVSIASPTPRVRSMNRLEIDAQAHLQDACNADAVLVGSGIWTREVPADTALMAQLKFDTTRQLLGAQCSGTLILARLRLLEGVTLGLVGDIKSTMEALLPRLKPRTSTEFRDKLVARHADALENHRSKAVGSDRGTIPPIYLTELINRHAASDAIFCADDGTPTVWLYRHIQTNGKRRVFSSLLHGTMAAALPMSLGLQKCQPGRQVISMSGDGGLPCCSVN